jgi:hypothetical protein
MAAASNIEFRSGLYLEINALELAMDKSLEETRGKRMYVLRLVYVIG